MMNEALKTYSAQDYASYFCNTLVLYDDLPVYVKEVRDIGETVFNIATLPSLLVCNLVSVSDPRLILNSFPQGYFTYKTVAAYLARLPCRKFHQGINGSNVSILTDYDNLDLDSVMQTEDFLQLFSQKYLALPVALQLISETGIIPLSREFAIKKFHGIKLLYKTKEIGDLKVSRFKLKPEYEHLREICELKGIPV